MRLTDLAEFTELVNICRNGHREISKLTIWLALKLIGSGVIKKCHKWLLNRLISDLWNSVGISGAEFVFMWLELLPAMMLRCHKVELSTSSLDSEPMTSGWSCYSRCFPSLRAYPIHWSKQNFMTLWTGMSVSLNNSQILPRYVFFIELLLILIVRQKFQIKSVRRHSLWWRSDKGDEGKPVTRGSMSMLFNAWQLGSQAILPIFWKMSIEYSLVEIFLMGD